MISFNLARKIIGWLWIALFVLVVAAYLITTIDIKTLCSSGLDCQADRGAVFQWWTTAIAPILAIVGVVYMNPKATAARQDTKVSLAVPIFNVILMVGFGFQIALSLSQVINHPSDNAMPAEEILENGQTFLAWLETIIIGALGYFFTAPSPEENQG